MEEPLGMLVVTGAEGTALRFVVHSSDIEATAAAATVRRPAETATAAAQPVALAYVNLLAMQLLAAADAEEVAVLDLQNPARALAVTRGRAVYLIR